MPNCMICKEPVASGLVLCGACAGDYVALDYFIDRLAEDAERGRVHVRNVRHWRL